jgi:hypothetical protein
MARAKRFDVQCRTRCVKQPGVSQNLAGQSRGQCRSRRKNPPRCRARNRSSHRCANCSQNSRSLLSIAPSARLSHFLI